MADKKEMSEGAVLLQPRFSLFDLFFDSFPRVVISNDQYDEEYEEVDDTELDEEDDLAEGGKEENSTLATTLDESAPSVASGIRSSVSIIGKQAAPGRPLVYQVETEDTSEPVDPNIILATYDALSNPMSVKYETRAYQAVNNVQLYCKADLEALCKEPKGSLSDIVHQVQSMNLAPSLWFRRLTEAYDEEQARHQAQPLSHRSPGGKLLKQLLRGVMHPSSISFRSEGKRSRQLSVAATTDSVASALGTPSDVGTTSPIGTTATAVDAHSEAVIKANRAVLERKHGNAHGIQSVAKFRTIKKGMHRIPGMLRDYEHAVAKKKSQKRERVRLKRLNLKKWKFAGKRRRRVKKLGQVVRERQAVPARRLNDLSSSSSSMAPAPAAPKEATSIGVEAEDKDDGAEQLTSFAFEGLQGLQQRQQRLRVQLQQEEKEGPHPLRPPPKVGPKPVPKPFPGAFKPPPEANPPPAVWPHDEHDDGDDDDDEKHAQHKNHGRHGKECAVPRDSVYSGSLGFGEQADACLYRRYKDLSPSCQGAVKQLYAFRGAYWSETADVMTLDSHGNPVSGHQQHHKHGGFLFLVLFCLGLAAVAYRQRHQKMKKIRRILDVIDANPSLKQQVESAAGCTIPPHNRAVASLGAHVGSCCALLCRAVLLLVCTFFVAVTSLMIAHSIVVGLSHESDGDEHHVNPLVALFIFLCVAAVEAVLLARVLRYVMRRWRSRRDSDGDGDEDDEEEEEGDLASHPRANRAYPGSQNMLSYLPGGNLWFSSSHNGGGDDGYTLLEGQEMTGLSSHARRTPAPECPTQPSQLPVNYGTPMHNVQQGAAVFTPPGAYAKQQQQQQHAVPRVAPGGRPTVIPASQVNLL